MATTKPSDSATGRASLQPPATVKVWDVPTRTFHWLLVESLAATFDIVADPDVVEGDIVEGGTVEVGCVLIGRLIEQA